VFKHETFKQLAGLVEGLADERNNYSYKNGDFICVAGRSM